MEERTNPSKNNRFNSFSVPLGLLDYANPILYAVTVLTVLINTFGPIGTPYNITMLTGAVMSILFGLAIPTGKVLVGLGKIKFVMPVSLVFCVNTGIMLSGLMLFRYVTDLNWIALVAIISAIFSFLTAVYLKTKKPNTIAVLIGAFGYLLIYSSLITLSVRVGVIIPVVLYALAILLFIMLCGIGIKADLKNPKIHWVIEISNVVCQLLVAVTTVILFA